MTDQPNKQAPMTRDEMRAKILATKPIDKRLVTFQGVEIELRQPLLGDVLKAADQVNRESAVIDTLIKYAYIPGTDERIFEEGDAEAFKQMPFGPDFMAINEALEGMMKINPKQQPSG